MFGGHSVGCIHVDGEWCQYNRSEDIEIKWGVKWLDKFEYWYNSSNAI